MMLSLKWNQGIIINKNRPVNNTLEHIRDLKEKQEIAESMKVLFKS